MVVLLAALALALLTAGAVAQAQSGGETTQQAQGAKEKTERHCVAAAIPAESEEASEVGPLAEPQVECFATFRKAVEKATGGRIKDTPNAASEAARNKKFRDRLSEPARSGGDFSTQSVTGNDTVGYGVVLSIEYEDASFRGNTLTFAASNPCADDGQANYVLPNIGEKWNDEISSFQGANRCDLRHFEHADYRGRVFPYTGVYAGSATMSGFNDVTTSIRWY